MSNIWNRASQAECRRLREKGAGGREKWAGLSLFEELTLDEVTDFV